MIALIDADVVTYKCGFSSQKTIYRFVYNNGSKIDYNTITLTEIKKDLAAKGITSSAGALQKLICPEPVEFAFQRVKMLVDSILSKTDADSYKMYLTSNDKSNFRFKIATIKEYKGNRKNMKRPLHYEAIRDYLQDHYDAQMIYDEEADDAMGIAQMKALDKSIICSIDKDLDMIPGYHYNMDTQEMYTATDPGTIFLDDSRRKVHGRGLKWFYAQMLLGDNADNIPGAEGYGPVKVIDTLKNENTEGGMYEAVKDVYAKQYGPNYMKAFREVGNLLWIRRHEGEVKFNE